MQTRDSVVEQTFYFIFCHFYSIKDAYPPLGLHLGEKQEEIWPGHRILVMWLEAKGLCITATHASSHGCSVLSFSTVGTSEDFFFFLTKQLQSS